LPAGLQRRNPNSIKACVIGAGSNGLSAAIVLAQAGCQVEVFEAEPQPGGAARTLELTLPGFWHDFGSAIHPMAAGSPFFKSLPLEKYGLRWIHSSAVLAHPFDNGTAVTLERDFQQMESALGEDGRSWRRLLEPFARQWEDLASEILRPVIHLPKHPLLLSQFGWKAMLPATSLASAYFRNPRTQALFAGIAAHSTLNLNRLLSGAVALVLSAAGHAGGWPVPAGGSQAITNALCRHLESLGGMIKTSSPVENLDDLEAYDLIFCNITPRQLLKIAGRRLTEPYRRKLANYRYAPGAFKVDYALSQPIPWRATECLRAATVHLSGRIEETVASEAAMSSGRHAEKPLVILAQPSLFDPGRAPQGKHTAWAYCHVPNGSSVDMLPKLEAQIERFAPGFRDCILARRVFFPAGLEAMDANLVGGDIGGGDMSLGQFLFRPSIGQYYTSVQNIYLCSSSTPPGGGVHGMCGYRAARVALANL
jgi:phytoene dehydrogenase-like protein